MNTPDHNQAGGARTVRFRGGPLDGDLRDIFGNDCRQYDYPVRGVASGREIVVHRYVYSLEQRAMVYQGERP